ncbi:MAG: ATP-binding protein [Synechococcales bacterium]|nr:ATP-binding protein [Synechococcales bacterium]
MSRQPTNSPHGGPLAISLATSSWRRLSLRSLLILPFVLQICFFVGLTGYISLQNGQKAVNELVLRLQKEVSGRIEQHLASYLAAPRQLSQMNARAVSQGAIQYRDFDAVGNFLHHQVQLNDIGYIGIGLENGEYIASGRTPEGIAIDVLSKPRYGDSLIRSYLADQQGQRTRLMGTLDYPFREDAWYAETIRLGKPNWSPVYQWKVEPFPIAVAASAPIYDRQGKVMGVFSVDQQLTQISAFLKQLKVSRSGTTFIMEHNGMLVASSGDEQPVRKVKDKTERIKAEDSDNDLIRATMRHLRKTYPSLQALQTAQTFEFKHDGQREFVQVTPWRDELGLDWLVVVTIPEKDFLDKINANTRITILLCLASLICAIALSVLFARWLTAPINRLNQASQTMALGNWAQHIQGSEIRELDELARSFNQMAAQLQESFDNLENTNSHLEQRVVERTQELAGALEELQQTQAQLIQTEKMSSLGQMVAGIAHEVNNPVNFIHGNLNCFRNYLGDLQQMLDLYRQHYPQPVAEIQDYAEDCDFEFMLSDLPKLVSSMQEGTKRIREIVLSLRNFSRLDESEMKRVDLHQGLDSTLLMLTHRLKNKEGTGQIEVVKKYGELPTTECYPGQLNQVFLNVLSNAIDAIESVENPTIEIRTKIEDKQAIISITDNGIGIPETDQNKLFDPFFTTKEVGKGTGLGLSISYQIIQKHKGTIQCISSPDNGATFIIQIPLNQS